MPREALAYLLPFARPFAWFRPGGIKNVGAHLTVLELPSPGASTWIEGDDELRLVGSAGALPEGACQAQAVHNGWRGRLDNPDRGEQEVSHGLSLIRDGAAP